MFDRYEVGSDEIPLCSLAKQALEEVVRIEEKSALKPGELCRLKAEMLAVVQAPLSLYKEAEEPLAVASGLTQLCSKVRDVVGSVSSMRKKLKAFETKAKTFTQEELLQDFCGISNLKTNSRVPSDVTTATERRDGNCYTLRAEFIIRTASWIKA